MMKLNASSDTNFDSNHLISTEYYPKIRIFTRSEEGIIHNYIRIIFHILKLKDFEHLFLFFLWIWKADRVAWRLPLNRFLNSARKCVTLCTCQYLALIFIYISKIVSKTAFEAIVKNNTKKLLKYYFNEPFRKLAFK